jgi:Cu/Zn superoxide dismutase/glucose/arabinose dehydrogenase/mono/diheme cytochrome c family protein
VNRKLRTMILAVIIALGMVGIGQETTQTQSTETSQSNTQQTQQSGSEQMGSQQTESQASDSQQTQLDARIPQSADQVARPGEGGRLPGEPRIELVEVATGFIDPVNVTSAGDGSGRLFVVERHGRVMIVENGEVLEEPFLDITDLTLSAFLEQGLYDLEFHPDFANNGRFYIHFAELLRNGDSMIVEYQVSQDNPNQADPESARVIMQIEQPWANHNGGEIAFGPDGYLYIGSGDGGWEGDPLEAGQNLGTVLGKLLRIDVNTSNENLQAYTVPADNPFTQPTQLVQLFGITEQEFASIHTEAEPEVWAYGLRNPWKFQFDRETGDLYLPDVSQNHWEEINFQPAHSQGGENYGWDFLMGTHCFPIDAESCAQVGILPIAEYSHEETGGCAVIGIGIYRGDEFPELDGIYFVGDYCAGTIWGIARDEEQGRWVMEELYSAQVQLTGSGEDENGNLYVTSCRCNYGGPAATDNPPGTLWRVVAAGQVSDDAETATERQAQGQHDHGGQQQGEQPQQQEQQEQQSQHQQKQGEQDGQSGGATAELRDREGNTVGNATLTPADGGGVSIQVTLEGFNAASVGEHGIHIHQAGACEPDFQAAGSHFNPTDAQHGLLNRDGPHAGDLPNISVQQGGNAEYNVTTRLVTLGEGNNSLLDQDGSALVIHANPDDYATDPSGNSGDHIACGVISREGQQGQQAQQTGQQGQGEQQGQQQQTAAPQQQQSGSAQQGQGQLEISVEPSDANVQVVGPNGYNQRFSGGQSLENLTSGTYVVMATQRGYKTSSRQVEVTGAKTANVNLTLETTGQNQQQEQTQQEQGGDQQAQQQDQQQGERSQQQGQQGQSQQAQEQQGTGSSQGSNTEAAVNVEQLAQQGQEVYMNNCAVCHGNQGKGASGPALAGNDELQNTEHVVNQILHGGGGMPPFADQLSDEQIAAVATFIRTNWRNDFGAVSPEQVAEQQ